MINLRMLALAAALFILLPIGVNADPLSDVYEVEGEVMAIVSDLRILEPRYKREGPPDWELVKKEQLVEGHTVFVTIETTANVTRVEGNITIDGFVHCENHGEVKFSWWNGIPYPTRVEEARVECRVGQRVIVTPTVYCTLTGDPECTTSGPMPVMHPTGELIPFETPLFDQAYAEELSFVVEETDDWGITTQRTYYAWATPIFHPWLADDGAAKNIMLPIPEHRLREMGTQDFRILYEDKVPRA